MNLLVPVGNHAAVIDPQDSVLHPVAIETRFMDADVDSQLFPAGLLLKSEDELTLAHRLDETDGFFRGASDVVACFGKEEGLHWDSAPCWEVGMFSGWGAGIRN